MANKEQEKLWNSKFDNDAEILKGVAEQYVTHHDRVQHIIQHEEMPEFIFKTLNEALSEAESLRAETVAHYVLGLDLFKQKMDFEVYCEQYAAIMKKLARADGVLYQALTSFSIWDAYNRASAEVENEHQEDRAK